MVKLFKNRSFSQIEANKSHRGSSQTLPSSNASFPLPTFETFKTSISEKQLSGSVDLQLYHNVMRSLNDSDAESTYMDEWLLAAQEPSEEADLIEGILLEDAVIGISQCFKFIESKPVSTADPETWAFIIDALCCASRLACSPAFRSNMAPDNAVPLLVFTVARLCDGVFRLANRNAMTSVPSSCVNLPSVSPENWTECICRDIVCGRSSAWIALAKANACQIGKPWFVKHEVYAKMRAVFLTSKMQEYRNDSDEHEMAEALDLAFIVFAKAYRDISVRNKPAWISEDSAKLFADVGAAFVDVLVCNYPELSGGYGDIFGTDPLEQVAFLSRHYREVLLNGS